MVSIWVAWVGLAWSKVGPHKSGKKCESSKKSKRSCVLKAKMGREFKTGALSSLEARTPATQDLEAKGLQVQGRPEQLSEPPVL